MSFKVYWCQTIFSSKVTKQGVISEAVQYKFLQVLVENRSIPSFGTDGRAWSKALLAAYPSDGFSLWNFLVMVNLRGNKRREKKGRKHGTKTPKGTRHLLIASLLAWSCGDWWSRECWCLVPDHWKQMERRQKIIPADGHIFMYISIQV